MQEIVRIVSEHPLATVGVAFAVLLILYFIFAKLVKAILILLLAAIAVGGYFYFQYPPGERPANLKEAVEKVRTETSHAVEKGKKAYDKGKEIVDKGKEIVDKGKKIVDKGKDVLDKGIDKGKGAVDKGKGAADEIGKLLGREKE